MPAIVFTVGELFTAAIDAARELSERILKLSDLEAMPLNPGESPDARRHQIAKLGKQLAETFKSIDELVQAAHEHHHGAHAHASEPATKPDDPGAN